MQVRQEQAVFAIVLVVLGAMYVTGSGEQSRRGSSRVGDAPELDRFAAPNASAVMDVDSVDTLGRALFSPPRDTRPLDPLAFNAPPLPERLAVAPPPLPGPAPRAFARTLQTYPGGAEQLGLFDLVEAGGSAQSEVLTEVLDEFTRAFESEFAQGQPGGADGGASSETLAGVLEELSSSGLDVTALEGLDGPLGGGAGGASGFAVENEFLDAEERRQREQAYYRLYDFVRLNEAGVEFGRLQNSDPYSLRDTDRASETIVFQIYDPDSGKPKFGNSPPFEYERERVLDFGLADTLENQIRQRYHDARGPLTPSTVEGVRALAGDCVDARLEVPGALALAEELYQRVDEAYPEDPRGALGLARTFESGFAFEAAFAKYDELIERFPVNGDVLAGLGRLEARFRMFDTAEARLRRAIAVDRSSYLGHAELGRLLLQLDRPAEARVAFADAFTRLPAGADMGDARHAVRLDHGAALLALGEVEDATRLFSDAWSAQSDDPRALAGLAACAYLGNADARAELPDWLSEGGTPPADEFESVGFDLLLAGGLLAAQDGELASATRSLRQAITADPLRAHAAHRALSWIAEVAGDEETAIDSIESALESDPSDPWSHFQRGRLMLARDDLSEASASFRRALEAESNFEDAVMGLGVTAWASGDSEAAELYFERAVLLIEERLAAVAAGADSDAAGAEPRADVHALRGINLLDLGEFLRARAAFAQALEIDPRYAPAMAGQAWAIYRMGDVEEALIQLRGIDDALRDRPQDDGMRVWARAEIERVADHAAKDVWTDRFEYSTLGNDWERREAAGPQASLQDGELVLAGNFKTVGEARYERLYEASKFVSIEARIRISGDSNARAGLFVARESGRGSRARVQAYAAIARSRDGIAQYRTVVPGNEESEWVDLPELDFPFPADEWVDLAIERRGDGSETTVTIFLDGIPVVEELPMSTLARGNNALQIGVFAEGDTGRKVEVRMDDVEVVRIKG